MNRRVFFCVGRLEMASACALAMIQEIALKSEGQKCLRAFLSLFFMLAEADAVLPGGAVLDLPEGLDKVAGVRKAAFQSHLAGLEPGGAQQLGGFFHPELFDVLDGCDAQKLPEAAQTGAFAQGNAASFSTVSSSA